MGWWLHISLWNTNRELDRAVSMVSPSKDFSEAGCAAALMSMYEKLVGGAT